MRILADYDRAQIMDGSRCVGQVMPSLRPGHWVAFRSDPPRDERGRFTSQPLTKLFPRFTLAAVWAGYVPPASGGAQ